MRLSTILAGLLLLVLPLLAEGKKYTVYYIFQLTEVTRTVDILYDGNRPVSTSKLTPEHFIKTKPDNYYEDEYVAFKWYPKVELFEVTIANRRRNESIYFDWGEFKMNHYVENSYRNIFTLDFFKRRVRTIEGFYYYMLERYSEVEQLWPGESFHYKIVSVHQVRVADLDKRTMRWKVGPIMYDIDMYSNDIPTKEDLKYRTGKQMTLKTKIRVETNAIIYYDFTFEIVGLYVKDRNGNIVMKYRKQ